MLLAAPDRPEMGEVPDEQERELQPDPPPDKQHRNAEQEKKASDPQHLPTESAHLGLYLRGAVLRERDRHPQYIPCAAGGARQADRCDQNQHQKHDDAEYQICHISPLLPYWSGPPLPGRRAETSPG